jgi:iron complex outermembrane receptor protein
VQQSVRDVLDQGYKLNQNDNGEMRDRTSNASLVVQHDGAAVTFTSQTAYQSNYRYYRDPLDGDFSPLKIVSISNDYGRDWNRVKVWTQEFRFSSPASMKGPWNWTAGAYLFDQHNPVKQATNFGDDAALIGAEPDIALVNSSVEKSNGQAYASTGNTVN